MLYFGFGSNVFETQMRRRCPSARKIANASLPGYRLTFTGYSGAWGGATATIVPDSNDMVFGVIYEIMSDADTILLDAYEGYPHVHDCREFLVHSLKTNQAMRVWAYVKRDAKVSAPSASYVETITRGFREHGMSETPVVRAAMRAVAAEEKRTGRVVGWPPRIVPPVAVAVPSFLDMKLPAKFGAQAPAKPLVGPKPKKQPVQPAGFAAKGLAIEWVLDGGQWTERVVRVAKPKIEAPKPKVVGGTRPRFAGGGWDPDDVRGQPW